MLWLMVFSLGFGKQMVAASITLSNFRHMAADPENILYLPATFSISCLLLEKPKNMLCTTEEFVALLNLITTVPLNIAVPCFGVQEMQKMASRMPSLQPWKTLVH